VAAVLDSPWGGTTFSTATALNIDSIEAAIVAQLQAAIGNLVEVIHFPDRPEVYESRHRIGVAMVIYVGGEYGEILDTGHIAQERTLEFEVGLRIRDLGWAFGGPPSGTSPGAYQLLESIRTALLGFQPSTGCTPMRAMREYFVERDKQGGVWVYAIRFATRMVAVENYQAPNFPLFVHGTTQDRAGQTATGVAAALYIFSTDSVGLGNPNISAVVVKSQNLATAYVAGTDYTVDAINGMVTRIAGGGITAGATVAISYAFADVATALASGGSAPFSPNN
jgi:Gp37 protein